MPAGQPAAVRYGSGIFRSAGFRGGFDRRYTRAGISWHGVGNGAFDTALKFSFSTPCRKAGCLPLVLPLWGRLQRGKQAVKILFSTACQDVGKMKIERRRMGNAAVSVEIGRNLRYESGDGEGFKTEIPVERARVNQRR